MSEASIDGADLNATLTKLFYEGLSASEAASASRANISRNAVLGRWHRMGLKRGSQTTAEASLRRKMRNKTDRDGAAERKAAAERRAHAADGSLASVEKERRFKVKPLASGLPRAPLPAEKQIEQQRVFEKVCGLPAALEKRDDERQCWFPIGDPKSPDFHYCTNPRAGRSGTLSEHYCAEHARILPGKPDPEQAFMNRLAWALKNPGDPQSARVVAEGKKKGLHA